MFLTRLFVFTLLPMHVFAYTDPGTGMIIIQGVIAGIAMFMAFVRNPIKTLKIWFGKKSKDDSEIDDNKN